MRYNCAMSALLDRVLSTSWDDLTAAADRGEIDPDELWDEMLSSLDRSTAILRRMNQSQAAATAYLDARLPVLHETQGQIDSMIEQWRVELDAAGCLTRSAQAPPDKPVRAVQGG